MNAQALIGTAIIAICFIVVVVAVVIAATAFILGALIF